MAPINYTYTYKTVGQLEIKLDLYLPIAPTKVPILLWFHGGGLLQGTRASVPPHMQNAVWKYNVALISADYRLAPQASVAEILQDVIDCLSFIRNTMPTGVNRSTDANALQIIDPTRIAIAGSSAGGYLALLAGLHAPIELRPKVILAIYPITNPFGSFFTNPQPAPEAIDRNDVAQYLDPKGPVMTDNGPEGSLSARTKMYYYMLQSANLAELLGLRKLGVDADKFIIAKQIVVTAKDGSMGTSIPSCYVVHGDADKFVGVEQADEVVEALRALDGAVDVEYERLPGLDHLFDKDEKYQMEGMYNFMRHFLFY